MEHAVRETAIIFLADDARGADGAGEEVVEVFVSVGVKDDGFRDSFSLGVVFDGVGDHERVVFVRVDEVGHCVVDYGGGRCVHEGFECSAPVAMETGCYLK